MKRCSLIITEIQIKTPMRYYLILIRKTETKSVILKKQQQKRTSFCKNVEKLELLGTIDGNVK